MATWSVQEPQINLLISDIPITYKAVFGPDFVFKLIWRQRNGNSWGGIAPTFGDVNGDLWGCDLFSQLYDSQADGGLADTLMEMNWGDGYVRKFQFNAGETVTAPNYFGGMWAQRFTSNNIVTRIQIHFRNGSVESYSRIGDQYYFRIDSRTDATGQAMTFEYDDPWAYFGPSRLIRVRMADGALFTINYDPTSVYRIIGVSGPNGRSTSFGYTNLTGTMVLTSITDAAGLVSTFGYDTSRWWITSMTTPYGTTSFTLTDNSYCLPTGELSCQGIDRSVVINEPGGTKQVYAFYDNAYDYDNPYYTEDDNKVNEMAGKIPTAFGATQIPAYSAGDPPVQMLDTARDKRNSHYWGRQQAALLSTTVNLQNLNSTDYKLSRTKHWLVDDGGIHPGMRTLGWELPPSPDAVNEVQPIFYDYAGKPTGSQHYLVDQSYEGTNALPSVMARRMPDGSTHYKYFERNVLGMKTVEIERWKDAGGTTRYRTNSFLYATGTGNPAVDNQLLLRRVENGVTVLGRALHPTYPDQIRYETNAVGEVTTFNYDGYRRLTTRQTAAGLLSTYTYDPTSLRLAKVVDAVATTGTPIRTNSYTWLNGYLSTHTDARGFQRMFYFDFLGRITQISYPDATTETFNYVMPAYTGFNNTAANRAVLDLVTYKDRMGNYSRTIPNELRQIERIVEPSKTSPGSFGTEHAIDWCGCGSPSAIERGSNTGAPEVTLLDYNYQGSLARVILPNGTAVTNKFDLLGRLAVREDALTTEYLYYDNLSRMVERRNGAGLVESAAYNNDDDVTTAIDASGVVMTNLYDGLGRLLVRGYPNGGKEMWFYTPGYAEATRHTNQIGNVTTWGYDVTQRRVSEVGVGVYTNSFVYSPADDVRELWDGKNQKTTWGYDSEGRVQYKWDQSNLLVLTNGYNANAQVAGRWTAAKGVTAFSYDRVGNLTFVNYPASPDITYQYDGLSRLTNMVDAAGTTKFAYNIAGDLLSEEAPWANSKVTYGYHANVPHLQTSASLQQPSGTWGHTFAYDSARRLQSVASPAGTFTYSFGGTNYASSLIRRLSLPGGAYITNYFDSSGRMTETLLRNSSHVNLNRHFYGYNNANQRTSQTRLDGSVVNYGYDTIGQLLSATGSEQLGYKYDAAFNLNVRTNAGVPTTFGVNIRNELTTEPNGTATYDANGNLTADGVRTFTYDDENQLASVAASGYLTEFVYDGLGRMRTRKEFPGGSGGSGSSQALATGVTLSGTLRNNADGWIGLKLAVGSSPLTVTELGRWVVSGNSGSHTVKLVTSGGADLASVSVSTAGKPAGAFAYATLASPVTLSANTSYYLVSQEFFNGDQWHEWDCSLATSGAASISYAAYNVGGGYVDGAGGSFSFGPVNLKYQTTSSQALVTGVTLSPTIRNDFSGWVGYRLTVGGSALTVSELGRWVRSGNSGSHTLKLVQSNGSDVAGGSVSVSTSGAPAGQFKYAALASPVTLSANTSYFLVSEEVSGGDYWYQYDGALTSTSAAAINNAAYAYAGTSTYYDFGLGGQGYGPVSLRYQTGSGGSTPTSETRYIYLGRLVVQERDSNNVPTVSYTRGWDLSGSLEGAGGIGGLLARSHGYSAGSWSTHNAYHADGNGNITALINNAQSVTANYRYDPYGNLLSSSGTMAAANAYRFSSKELIGNPGIYNYGFRFYEPNFQRWLNRDPIAEDGGMNLYGFAGNDPVGSVDFFGLATIFVPPGLNGPPLPGDVWVPCPEAPPGVNLFENMSIASNYGRSNPALGPVYNTVGGPGASLGLGAVAFYDRVKAGGDWDFKSQTDRWPDAAKYEPYGNFHFGATGAATGLFSPFMLQNEAGRAQRNDPRTSRLGEGTPEDPFSPGNGVFPFGDQLIDNWWIRQGIDYQRQYPLTKGPGPCN